MRTARDQRECVRKRETVVAAMPRTLRETAALVSLAAAPLVVPYLERVNGPLLPEQKAMLGSVLFVVGVNHRDALLDVALALLAAPGNLLTRIVGDDDDEEFQHERTRRRLCFLFLRGKRKYFNQLANISKSRTNNKKVSC